MMEHGILLQYYERLIERGVQNYSWDMFWYDYRLSVIRCLYVPAIHGGSLDLVWLWWSQLEKVMTAYEDLKCAELLD